MIYIKKSKEPIALTNWKKKHPNGTYGNLNSKIKRELRNTLLEEQGFVCCFCGKAIGVEDLTISEIIQRPLCKGEEHNTSNAHIIPQSVDSTKTLDYNNICASCDTRKSNNSECHCDHKQGNNCIPISPLQEDCLSFFSFNSDGTIEANQQKSPDEQQKAKETIDILGLNDKSLDLEREKRLNMFQELEELEEKDKLQNALKNISQRRSDGAFEAFYFVPLSYYNYII